MPKINKKIPLISVCWLLTSNCNYKCGFCFKVVSKRDLYYNEAEKILKKIAKYGVKKISFSGGEPLLWTGTIDLIRAAKSYGMITMLITNGSLISNKEINGFNGILDWLTLPLDGSSDKKQQLAGRKKNHYTNTVNLLKLLKNTQIKTKINTVFSKRNWDDMENIFGIIKKYNIKRWKIFQFNPIRFSGLKNKKKYMTTKAKFEQIKKKILSLVDNDKISVYFGSVRDQEESYFTIAPDGTVYVSKNNKDLFIGDLKVNEMEDIWMKNRIIKKEKYWQRAKWILNQRRNNI